MRLVVPDVRSAEVRRRIAADVSALPRKVETEALEWIESISEFDADTAR